MSFRKEKVLIYKGTKRDSPIEEGAGIFLLSIIGFVVIVLIIYTICGGR